MANNLRGGTRWLDKPNAYRLWSSWRERTSPGGWPVVSSASRGPADPPNTAPRVSVIVPAYNAAGYLERALDSALSQTMPDLEIVVIDDASVDHTPKVARRVAARDPRVRVLHNERNGGVSVSRNRGIGAAQGEWIALLDADDTWSPERLEQMLAAADGADLVSDDVYIVHEAFGRSDKPRQRSLIRQQGLSVTEPRRISLLDFVRHDLGLLKPIVRHAFLDRHGLWYDSSVRYAEDYLLYFEILALGARWLQLPQGYYLQYKHAGSISTTSPRDQSKKRVLWQNALNITEALLRHPAAARDAALAAALKRHSREAREHIIFATLWEALRRRRFAELAHLLRRRPTDLAVLAKYVSKRLRLRVMWRLRRPPPR